MVSAGEAKLENYNLIYSGGMTAALALDMHILQASDGRYRLDDVMPALYSRFSADTGARFDLCSLAQTIEERTSVNTRDLLQRYVAGLELFDGEELRTLLATTL